MNPINVIGIGQGISDLTARHLSIINDCDVLVGGRRHIALLAQPKMETLLITRDIQQTIAEIRSRMADRKVVVLASGDPLFYGIGSTLTRYFDKSQLRIHSNISSISAAFAAIREPWQDARIISLHSRQNMPVSFAGLAREKKVAFLTHPDMGPHFIAQNLADAGIHDFQLCVLEQLGDPDRETIQWFASVDAVLQQSFSDPNVVILLRSGKAIACHVSHETHIGMPEDRFCHHQGLITKSEIRSIVLSKLCLVRPDHLLWDIGAGSGSVSIEASQLISSGRVYAIEKDPGRISDINANVSRFGCSNIRVISQAFPHGIQDLETPDRIFIGGGGRYLDQVISAACDSLTETGVIVVNTVLLETLAAAVEQLAQKGFSPKVVQVQISRSKAMPFGRRFEAFNPVWIISGSKPRV